MTERQIRNKIRKRDNYYYNKFHGPIPEGMTLHHNYYNELWYDEDSFILITKEEHEWIHGCKIPASTGVDKMAKIKEYRANNREKINNHNKEYYKANSERLKAEAKLYRENNKDKLKAYIEQNKERRNEQSRNYAAKVKAVRESNGLKCKEWEALTKEDRKRLMDTFENGGNT